MDYFAAFDISASGMEVQKLRVDTVALNLANANTTRTADGGPYQPMQVVIGERNEATFERYLGDYQSRIMGAKVVEVRPTLVAPRMVHDPDHPHADENGMLALPNVNPVSEMVTLIEATRSYEANVRAANAAKTMALRALQIGE